ncbi:MAG: OB-fold nucleic acid binding domain-containing protein [Promethearchaeota archaeon]
MIDWTARRYRISQLINSEIKDEIVNDRRQAYLILNNRIITKVRIIGTVTRKITGERNYAGLQIDDGSGSIFCKSWDGSFEVLNEWDLVEIVGRLRVAPPREGRDSYDIYISPDIAIATTKSWEMVHRLELLRNMPASVTLDALTPPPMIGETAEPIVSDDNKEKGISPPLSTSQKSSTASKIKKQTRPSEEDLSGRLEQLIQDLDKGEGVSYETIADKVEGKEGEIDDALFKLLMDSKIYEPRPGRYRLINS